MTKSYPRKEDYMEWAVWRNGRKRETEKENKLIFAI